MKLTRRRVIVGGLGIATLVAVTLVFVSYFSLSVRDAARVKKGMSRAEVYGVLGHPGYDPPSTTRLTWWLASDGYIVVGFDDGIADEPGTSPYEFWWEQVHARYRLLKWQFLGR